EERLHLARRAASQAQDAGDAGVAFFLDHIGNMRTDYFHARPDAFGNFEAEPVHKHLIDVRAFALPIIDLVHHLEIAGIAEGLGIAAIPDGADAHLGCHHDFGERFGGLQDVAFAHYASHEVITGAPHGPLMLHQTRFAGL